MSRPRTQRGSVLVTALLIAIVLGMGLVGYLASARTALKLSQRTLYVNDAGNLAEAGLEEALYSFNQMNAGVLPATAWSAWTLSGANASRTLSFNRDQNALGTVKVFVAGYNGTTANAFVVAQATITPFDNSVPIRKIVRLGMLQAGLFNNGVVGLGGVTLKGQPTIDSFNSNPANSPTGPWRPYSAAISQSNSSVVVTSGAISLGNGLVKGNVSVASTVTPPSAGQVTGSIDTNYTGTFNMPTYPTAASVSRSYNLGTQLPATLPAATDQPAADGRYYYFVKAATIGNTAIAPGKNVVIVGTNTSMSSGLTVGAGATCSVYMDGTISASGKGAINNSNWAGALQIYTTTNSTCEISGNGELQACLFAPNAALTVKGGGSSGEIVGSFVAKTVTATGHVDFHYDEALRYLNTPGGTRWAPTSWEEIRPGSDLSTLSSTTGGFLP